MLCRVAYERWYTLQLSSQLRIVKLYKDKFVCKLCSEPAEKDSIQCKTCHFIFHFKCKDVSKQMSVEDGSAVVLEWPLNTTYNN